MKCFAWFCMAFVVACGINGPCCATALGQGSGSVPEYELKFEPNLQPTAVANVDVGGKNRQSDREPPWAWGPNSGKTVPSPGDWKASATLGAGSGESSVELARIEHGFTITAKISATSSGWEAGSGGVNALPFRFRVTARGAKKFLVTLKCEGDVDLQAPQLTEAFAFAQAAGMGFFCGRSARFEKKGAINQKPWSQVQKTFEVAAYKDHASPGVEISLNAGATAFAWGPTHGTVKSLAQAKFTITAEPQY